MHARPARASATSRPREVVPFASERSAGRELDGGLIVQPLRDETIAGLRRRASSRAGGSTSGEWAPRFADARRDRRRQLLRWRMDDDVPLVVPEVNPDALDAPQRASSPTRTARRCRWSSRSSRCTTRPASSGSWSSTYQAVSGTGKARGRAARRSRARARRRADAAARRSVYAAPDRLQRAPARRVRFAPGDDHTDEERKLINETRKILGDPAIRVSATCVRVPVVNGHSRVGQRRRRASRCRPSDARELLRAAPGVTVVDDPARRATRWRSTPRAATTSSSAASAATPAHEQALDLWVVADNLRKGAATNAVQLAELLHERGLLGTAGARRALA